MLTIRTANAIRAYLIHSGKKDYQFSNSEIEPKDVAELSFLVVREIPNLGKKGFAEIISWLADSGMSLKDAITNVPQIPKHSGALIRAAISLLEGQGYVVTHPLNSNS